MRRKALSHAVQHSIVLVLVVVLEFLPKKIEDEDENDHEDDENNFPGAFVSISRLTDMGIQSRCVRTDRFRVSFTHRSFRHALNLAVFPANPARPASC